MSENVHIISTYLDGTQILEATVPEDEADAAVERVREFRADQQEAPTVTVEPEL